MGKRRRRPKRKQQAAAVLIRNVRGSVRRYLNKHVIQANKKRGATHSRLRRFCIKHISKVLEGMPPQQRYNVLTYLDWCGFGFTLRYPEASTNHFEVLQARIAAGSRVLGSKLHRCQGCASTNIDYVQVQTRSADEPMTTFFSCGDCAKRWVG